MRLFSPLNVLLILVVWTVAFVVFARFFLYGTEQSWLKEEGKWLINSVELKIDNLDARNMRQLNQLYAEIQKIEKLLVAYREEIQQVNNKSGVLVRPRSGPLHEVEKPVFASEPTIAVLVIACDREKLITQLLDELLKYQPSAGLFPIVVSQDCGHTRTAAAIATYADRISHLKHPDLSDVVIAADQRKIKDRKAEIGYYKISRHYKWALTQVFEELGHQYVIIVEDDLIISSDFFSYFSALRRLLDQDPSIMCVSAWNDNGMEGYVNHQKNHVLYRTDFFPGLGWMLTKKLWLELKPKWPTKFWDDWLREPDQRKDRVCIRPEVSRTKTIGALGVSKGQYYNQHLKFIALNKQPVDFSKSNLTHLIKDLYDREFLAHVSHQPLVTLSDVLNGIEKHAEVRVQYNGNKDFVSSAKRLKIMPDLRGGVPRTAYLGIVSFMYRSVRVHLVPPSPWQGYHHL